MNIETQQIIMKQIIVSFEKYDVTTIDAIGFLENIKLSLFNESIKKVE